MKCSKNDLRVDGFAGIDLKLVQDPRAFCFGIDAVLLSDFARVKRDDAVIDLGTGSGVIPLIMSRLDERAADDVRSSGVERRSDGARSSDGQKFTALEIQKEQAELARQNVQINLLENKIKIVHGDIKNVRALFAPQSFNVVTSNPPYAVYTPAADYSGGRSEKAPEKKSRSSEKPGTTPDAKTIARQEVFCNLEDVIKAASYLLKPHGRFYMIHRPERLQDMMTYFSKYNLAAKQFRFVQPFCDSAPTMLLVQAVKDAKCGVKIEKPLTVYKEKNIYSEEVSDIYKKLN